MSLLKKIGKAISEPVKKVASVAVQTAAGFAGGGGVGAVGAGVRGIIRNTKTGKAEAITLRTTGQGAATGLITAAASAAALKGASLVAAKGGVLPMLKTAGGKLASFAKTGGLLGKGAELAKGFLSKGGGEGEVIDTTATDSSGNTLGDVAKNLSGQFGKAKQFLKENKGLIDKARGEFGGEGAAVAVPMEAGAASTPWWAIPLLLVGVLLMGYMATAKKR